MKDPPDFIFIILSNLAWGFLLALIFHRWKNVKSFGPGFSKGLALSFLVMLSFDSSMYAFYNLNTLTFIGIDLVVGTLFGGLVGGVVGLVEELLSEYSYLRVHHSSVVNLNEIRKAITEEL